MGIQWVRETKEDAHLIPSQLAGTRLTSFSYTAHLRSCTALSTTHPFDASESKGYMAALSTELSAK